MGHEQSRLERALYCRKYTLGSYADALSSVPIWAGEKIAGASERIFKEKNPYFLSKENIKENSVVYRGRDKLRMSLDTRPGALFLQNNVVGAIPFIAVGMPAAQLTQGAIDKYLSNAPEISQYIANSLGTLGAQMLTGYTVFMANEIRVNRDKYVNENNKLSFRKIGEGVKKAVKAFLTFDLSYIGAKTGGQSLLLAQGKDPWKASGLFDSLAIPVWYALGITLGLKNGVIVAKDSGRKNENNKHRTKPIR